MTASVKAIPLILEARPAPPESPARLVFRRFHRHKLAMASVVVIVVLFSLSLLARQVTSFSPSALAVGHYLLSPGAVDAKTGLVHSWEPTTSAATPSPAWSTPAASR